MPDRPPYRDRTDHYIPEGLHLPAPWKVEVGRLPENRTLHPATWGLADELNRRQGEWDWADVSPDFDGSHWSHLTTDWHRVQIDIELSTYNERSVHDWKGYDEIRPGGHWKLYFNRRQVCDGYVRDPLEALLTIRHRAQQLLGLHIDWNDPEGYLLNRKIFYREIPAIIYSTILSQGCVMIKPDGPGAEDGFPPAVWHEVETDGAMGSGSPDAKVELWSEHIWWYRREKN